ncbi:MAG: FtsW/RodA/SpoVE family cell cycle protein [Planctomycetes bacterium]|nr:FtsW/RodA/SpoVE family cell cycle protein [Planctomycetota bacterium]
MSADKSVSILPLRANGPGKALMLTGLSLLALGVVMVYSASASVVSGGNWMGFRHLLHALLAAVALATLWRMDYRILARGRGAGTLATVMLAVSLLLAAATMVPGVGTEINGARRWLRLGSGPVGISFQPSELVKLTMVIFLACWLGRTKTAGPGRNIRSFTRTFLPAAGLLAVCLGVVVTEDFGSAVVMAAVAVAFLALAGVPWLYLLTLPPPAAVGFFLLVVQVPMRWQRIIAFIHPWQQTRWTYQPQQALIAVGSGGFWGKGLGNGMLKLGFLPEDSTDYIFAVICEELGFIGAAFVLALIGLVLYQSWRIAVRSGDGVGRLLAGGLGVMIVLQALTHVAVNVGSAPPTGMSLPLVSAGGTALLLTAAEVAIIVSVSAHPTPVGQHELSLSE